MLCVVSPAKKLDEKPKSLPTDLALTEPAFLDHSWGLIQRARELTIDDLRRLMHLSEPLARLNVARYAAYQQKPDAPLAALCCATPASMPTTTRPPLRIARGAGTETAPPTCRKFFIYHSFS